jgi:hypothetical protein
MDSQMLISRWKNFLCVLFRAIKEIYYKDVTRRLNEILCVYVGADVPARSDFIYRRIKFRPVVLIDDKSGAVKLNSGGYDAVVCFKLSNRAEIHPELKVWRNNSIFVFNAHPHLI